ncbi:MAG TPA: hypothetical protein VKR54_03230 [Candidatus Babeliales bacterium]|jgi:hypothetical protein|nr:hypothetical protein [Candidatus Babeliales bacterium]
MKKVTILVFAFLTLLSPLIARSPFRKKDKDVPKITIGFENSKNSISRYDWVFTEYPIFNVFNEVARDYFYKNILPKSFITYVNNPAELINCKIVNNLIEELLREVKKQKKTYTHFDILKDSNFNRKERCGLLILKFKKYPLVLKLFMETPQSFIDPYCKGFENQFFFYMSGGMNRHIAGLTRVRNLEVVRNQIDNHPRWNGKITTPRKWYWLPKRHRWLKINGYNIGQKKEISTLMPSIYAIVADALDTKEDAPLLSSQQKSELIMELCTDLHLFVDPHADNFVIKYQKESNDYHISIIDTEHFPSIVGLQEEPFFNNHLEWYLYLGAKYFQDAFLQTKNDRRTAQSKINPCALKW